MSIVDLNFTGAYTPPNSNAANLNLGFVGNIAVDPRELAVVMQVAAPTMQITLPYSNNVSRPLEHSPYFEWQTATDTNLQSSADWGLASSERTYKDIPWDIAIQISNQLEERTAQFVNHKVHSVIPWAEAEKLNASDIIGLFKELERDRVFTAIPWQEASHVSKLNSSGFEQLDPIKTAVAIAWQDAQGLNVLRQHAFNVALQNYANFYIPWEEAIHPGAGREAPYVPPITPPYTPFYNLNFACKCSPQLWSDVKLRFGKTPYCPNNNVVIDRKVYFIVNSLHIKRVIDNIPIEFNSVSVGMDKDSWCWAFNGTIPYTEFDKVEPSNSGPVEIEVEINGLLWRVLVEKYGKKEVFAKTDIQVTGRSVTAYLENPYAPVRSFNQSTAIQSRQFAENELTRAGLITGFSLDWQLIDPLGWLMPANTWSYNDLTPIQVIQNIAQGAGGFVNSHPVQKQLIVLPDYPAPFWEWDAMTANKIIPESLIKARSLDWNEKPAYNGVYVSGENTGVTALVKRTGTAGDFQAPMYVNPMISHASAARNKGIALLSAGGKQARIGLDLPMESALGLVTPGMLIQVQPSGNGTGWKGLARATSISAAWGNGLTVNQSIELERHYGGL
jgi:hypothetical protein